MLNLLTTLLAIALLVLITIHNLVDSIQIPMASFYLVGALFFLAASIQAKRDGQKLYTGILIVLTVLSAVEFVFELM